MSLWVAHACMFFMNHNIAKVRDKCKKNANRFNHTQDSVVVQFTPMHVMQINTLST